MPYSDDVLEAAERLHIRPEAVQTYLDAGRGVRADGVKRSLHTTAKPVGSTCNLDCPYCYYLGKEELLGQRTPRMDDALLEKFVIDTIAAQDVEEIQFTWHGGEPTLMGLRFFERVVEVQREHTPPGRRVVNDLQTNGTLLDDEWCALLAANDFLVGLSVDGPRDLHDVYRPTKNGAPTFDRVFAAAKLLQKYRIGFSTLTTVNNVNAKHALRVYRFLRDELGARYLQFIPCVEPREFESVPSGFIPLERLVAADSLRTRPDHPTSVVTPWTVDPNDWGEFLSAIFDDWHAHDRGIIKINLFESMFEQLEGRPALLCTQSPICGKNVALEHDGRVYSCDHFVYPEHEIGHLGKASLGEIVFSLKQLEFGLDKFNSLPSTCRSCDYLKLCWGECPRTRILRTAPGEGNLSYLCAGWKRFYGHVLPKLVPPPRRP